MASTVRNLEGTPGVAESRELVAQPAGVLEVIAAAASDPRVDADKLEKLLALKERIDAKDAEREFNRDFIAAKSEMPRILKQGVIDMGSKGQIPFARYEDLDRAIRPIETKYGFTRCFITEPAKEPGILMTVKVAHRSGHSERSTRFMPPDPGPGRNGMQAIGSASSYAKRYLTIDVWDIVCEGMDNDASKADPLNEQELNNVLTLIDACELNAGQVKAFLKFAQADTLESIQRFRYPEVLAALQKKLAIKEGRA